jgi:hypothetical protein
VLYIEAVAAKYRKHMFVVQASMVNMFFCDGFMFPFDLNIVLGTFPSFVFPLSKISGSGLSSMEVSRHISLCRYIHI